MSEWLFLLPSILLIMGILRIVLIAAYAKRECTVVRVKLPSMETRAASYTANESQVIRKTPVA